MKASIAAPVLLAFTAFASPADKGHQLRSADNIDDEPATTGELSFIGPVTVGGPDITLHGTAESIYKQVIKLNPNYDEELGPKDDEAKERALEARQSINCSWGSKIGGWANMCSEGYSYLKKLGNARCAADPGVEVRVSCSHGCGMYLTSLTGGRIEVYCGDIANDMATIAQTCASPAGFVHGSMTFWDHWTGLGGTRC